MHRATSIAVLVLFLSSGATQAQDSKWGAHLDVEAKPGNKRSLAEGDLFLPLWQDGRSLLFGNLRGRFDNDDAGEGNLGLGVRRMYEAGWNLGGYGYFDRRKTENGNYFDQATFGGEALGRDWDLRVNAYLPYGDKVRDLGTTSTASVSANTVVVSSVTTQERALKGYDAEIGWRVPLFDADGPSQLRVYAGGYQFKDDVTSLSGPRVRVELTMAEVSWLWQGAQLVLGAEAQDDDVRGGQTYASLRLRIPLGGKAERPRLNWQERRMTAPVVRDVDIVAPAIARAPIVETATALADGRAFTVVSSETTTGAQLPAALAAAGPNSTVILSGTFNTVGTTTLQAGQTLAGSILVRTASGRTAMTPTATIAATPSGSTHLNAVIAANNSTINGLTITSTASAGFGANGMLVTGVTGVTIMNNTITATETGVNDPNAVVVSGGGSATLIGNRLTAIGSATRLPAALNVINATVFASGNTLSATGSTAAANNWAAAFNGATILSGSTGNVSAAGFCHPAGGASTGSLSFADGTTCP